jgi:hypothetical protein
LEIQGQVLSVSGRKTQKGNTIFEVAFSDGKTYTTFDNLLANQAKALEPQNGQPAPLVQAQVEVSQNGQYTNYNLKAIRPAGGVTVLSTPSGQVVGASVPIPIAPAPTGRGRDPEVEARIVRQNVLGTAFNFVAHFGDEFSDHLAAKAAALALAKELFTHAFHGTPTTSPEVAAQVNEVLAGAVTVGAPQATTDW